MKTKKTKRRKPDAVEKFLALSPAQKAAELAPFERGEIPFRNRVRSIRRSASCGNAFSGVCAAARPWALARK
jgi:hypothetical protein